MNFEFATAGRILFGAGQIKQLPDLARAHGSSALVVIGKQSDRTDSIRRMLSARGISVTPFSVPQEPTLELVTEGAARDQRESRQRQGERPPHCGSSSRGSTCRRMKASSTGPRPSMVR